MKYNKINVLNYKILQEDYIAPINMFSCSFQS